MNRVEFMHQLERLLADIPESDRQDAITYYQDYFDEAGPEREASVIRELGSPERVAAVIKADLNHATDETTNDGELPASIEQPGNAEKKKEQKKFPWALVIVLLIFASPILISVFGGLFGGILGLFAALVGMVVAVVVCSIAFIIAGIVLVVVGIIKVIISPMEGLLTLGLGSVMFALGILFMILFIWTAFKWIPALFRGCVNVFQKIFLRRKGGNQV